VTRYASHGLSIDSQVELTGLPASSVPVDLTMRRGEVRPWPESMDANQIGFAVDGDEARYFKPEVGAFLARRGEEILVDTTADATEAVVRLSLLGPVLSLALHQRGRFILHASAIETSGRVAAFCGENGGGKSSIVAALSGRDHGFMADDLCSIDLDAELPLLFPGTPQIKLWPDSASALSVDTTRTHVLHPEFDKLGLDMTDRCSGQPLPLDRVYVIADAEEFEIEPMHSADALQAIVRHWYGARFGPRLRTSSGPRHFLDCVRVADRTDVFRLRRPRSFDRFDELLQGLERHLAAAVERVSG
jgi:hypothetical protein